MSTQCPKCDTENTSDSQFCNGCATPLPSSKEIPVTATLETPTEELTTGSIFAGRYQIIEELGKGGMGNHLPCILYTKSPENAKIRDEKTNNPIFKIVHHIKNYVNI